MIQLKDIDIALAEFLLDNLESKQWKPSYKDVAAALSTRLGRPINPHYNLAVPLGNVSTLCHDLGLPLLSARVIYSGSSATKVGEGFYAIACDLKPEYKNVDPATAWKQELELIKSCKDWSHLRNFLNGAPTASVSAQPHSAAPENPFSCWLTENTHLSDSSIGKYTGALGTVSKEMLKKGTISKPLENMSSFELDLGIALIMHDPDFAAKNTRGNHMYSNALKQYRYFMHSVSEESSAPDYLECIRNIETDSAIPETERTAIVQSRIGQGIFRKSLLDKYSNRCIITGITLPKLLVASHIKPWAVSSNKERLCVDNGLLLSATYDRLFDSGLITFDRTGKIFISSLISQENAQKLTLRSGMSYNLSTTNTMAEFLDYHNDIVFVK